MKESPENFPVQEQPNRQEKFAEILGMMSSFKSLNDSNKAYEVSDSIKYFKKEFETDGLKLEDYLLGAILLSTDVPDESKYPYYDTEDCKIESFIRKLYEQQ